MNIGIIGSGRYRNKAFVISVLEKIIDKEVDVIVSGHSPRNKHDNVDVWAERWAEEHCKNPPDIKKPKSFTREGFFARNKEIAESSDILIAFIPMFVFKSGAWNTIKYFLMKERSLKNLTIYNEKGREWTAYPSWVFNYVEPPPRFAGGKQNSE